MEENFSDNATALFGTKGVQLVMDGAKVTGVIAQDSDGNYLKINAKNGVVLAGGGFGGNKEMMDDLLPDIKRLFTKDEDFFAPFGRDGSTIQMGVWAGGRLEGDISTMNFDSMAVPDYLPGPLWVDENGQRFQNEAFAGPEINGFFMARAKRGNIISIYDSTYETQILRGFPGHQAFEYDMPAVVEAMKGTTLRPQRLLVPRAPTAGTAPTPSNSWLSTSEWSLQPFPLLWSSTIRFAPRATTATLPRTRTS